MHVLREHNGTKTEFYRTNTKSQGLVPTYFALIIIIVVHVYSKHQSVLINTMKSTKVQTLGAIGLKCSNIWIENIFAFNG